MLKPSPRQFPSTAALALGSCHAGAALQADFMLLFGGSLAHPAVPAYTGPDARFAWQPRRYLELSLAGQNLLHRTHSQCGAPTVRQLIERALTLNMALRC